MGNLEGEVGGRVVREGRGEGHSKPQPRSSGDPGPPEPRIPSQTPSTHVGIKEKEIPKKEEGRGIKN